MLRIVHAHCHLYYKVKAVNLFSENRKESQPVMTSEAGLKSRALRAVKSRIVTAPGIESHYDMRVECARVPSGCNEDDPGPFAYDVSGDIMTSFKTPL